MNTYNQSNLEVREELIKQALENLPISSIAIFSSGVIISTAFWDISNPRDVLVWFSLLTALLIFRNAEAFSYLKNSSKKSLDKAEKRFKSYTLLTAVIMSGEFIFLFPTQEPLYQAFLFMVIAGLTAGAVMSLGAYRSLTILYIMILLLPFTYTLFIQDKTIYTLISALMIIFFILLIVFLKKYNNNLISVVTSKFVLMQTQKELLHSQNRFHSIFKQAPIGVFTYNKDLIIEESNQAFAELIQAPLEELINLDMKTLPDARIKPTLEIVINGNNGFYEGPYRTKISDKLIWINMQTVPLYDISNNFQSGLGIVKDITKRVKADERIHHQAFYDSLTGLANRMTLYERLEQQIARLDRHQRFGGVLFMDIDNFKNINDSLGHQVGDELLKAFATRFSNIIRTEDTLSRLGGDEFVILLSDIGTDEVSATKASNEVAVKLHKLLTQPLQLTTNSLTITISIGVKLISSSKETINDILKDADIAMYKAKQSGRNNTRFFEQKMSDMLTSELTLERELHEALKEEQFELYFQPIVETKTGKITSCEALIRWNHPNKGVVFPDNFIPHAQKSDLIIEIGDWVIKDACLKYKTLQESIKTIAINISPKQFQKENFVNNVMRILQAHDVRPSAFKLELTESVAIDNLPATIDKMNELKSFGFTFAMDDFGTGYSSLSYLKNLPFDFLKIDRSFIQNISTHAGDANLVKTLVSISKQFKLEVIAEGVETKEHMEFLKHIDCEYVQGYFISKPLPLKKFQELL